MKAVSIATAVTFAMLPNTAVAAVDEEASVTRGCPEVGNVHVTATPVNRNFHIGVGTIFRSGPGGTIKVTTTGNHQVSVTSNISGTIGVDEIVKATIAAGVSTAMASSRSTSYGYEHSVTPGRYGNLQYGNYGTKVNISKTTIVSPCNTKVVASGTAIVPSNKVWGYRYWES